MKHIMLCIWVVNRVVWTKKKVMKTFWTRKVMTWPNVTWIGQAFEPLAPGRLGCAQLKASARTRIEVFEPRLAQAPRRTSERMVTSLICHYHELIQIEEGKCTCVRAGSKMRVSLPIAWFNVVIVLYTSIYVRSCGWDLDSNCLALHPKCRIIFIFEVDNIREEVQISMSHWFSASLRKVQRTCQSRWN